MVGTFLLYAVLSGLMLALGWLSWSTPAFIFVAFVPLWVAAYMLFRAQARHARRLISSQVNFSGYDASVVGEQIIAVSYGEMVCTYTVTVAPELIEIGLNEEAATGGYIKDGMFFIPCKVNSPVGISPRIVCVAATSGEVAGWRMLVRSGGSNVAITDDYPLQLDAGSRLTVIIEADVRAEDGSISVFRREVVFVGIENNDAAAR